MKKFLVVLLILAVAGGVFAQGSWNLSGYAYLGTLMDFDRETTDDPIVISGQHYNINDDQGNSARLDVMYNLDGLSTGFTFMTDYGIWMRLRYDGDRYSFGALQNLPRALIGIPQQFPGPDLVSQTQVWGFYQAFDGLLHFEAALKGRWNPWYQSDVSVANLFQANKFGYGAWADGNGQWGDLSGWVNFCCNGGFLANFSFAGIDFGVASFTSASQWFDYGTPAISKGSIFHPDADFDLVEDILGRLIIGMKFSMSPIDFAAQFNLENYGAYLGMKWGFSDSISFGLNFHGIFEGGDATAGVDEFTQAAFAVTLDFNGGFFGAGVIGGYRMFTEDGSEAITEIGVKPSFWYNAIPDHLQIRLAGEFFFGDYRNAEEYFIWNFFPGIFWNFKGTGAVGGMAPWQMGTGFGLMYRISGGADWNTTNELEVTFKWNFF